MTRHMFAGGNTPGGFFSFFDSFIQYEDFNRIIYLKGSSGGGKSTFIRKVGEAMESRNLDVDYFHCSNDPKSLDGLYIKQLGLGIFDGTAPHMSDPKAPMIYDELLNFGDYIRKEKISATAEEIRCLQRAKADLVSMAYNYFGAAEKIYVNNYEIYKDAVKQTELSAKIIELQKMFADRSTELTAKNKKMFASAVSPCGYKNFIDSVLNSGTLYLLQGESGMGMDVFLAEMQKTANLHGLDTESFYCPISPDKIEHLIIPGLDVCMTTANEFHRTSKTPDFIINFNELADEGIIACKRALIEYNKNIFNELMSKAMATLELSRDIHGKIEEIYFDSIDFEGLDELCDRVVSCEL